MQKAAPSIGKILVAAGFALSCFGLILFLWVAFGGPVPLKSKSYRITAYFPEATQLAVESDVRIGGVSVGKVKAIELAPPDLRIDGQDLTEAEIEIQPEFAPISSDARAILRQKTLLGETYVELTSGNEPGTEAEEGAPVSLGTAANISDAEIETVEAIPEEGTLGVSQTENQTQIDEIFNALDEQTRASFQRWQQNAAVAIQGRGGDLNSALGNLGPFLTDASDVLAILKRQKQSLKGVVRDTGTVFEALTEREDALRGLITNSNSTFEALASEEQALQDTFQVFPTFERETRATFDRLDAFQENTLPLILDLQPVAEDLSPTLRSVRQLSPNLSTLFVDLDDLVRVSKRGLPSLARFVDGATPLLNSLDPFLANLNPVLSYLEFYKTSATDFLSNPPAGLSGTLTPEPGQPSARHVLRQIGYITEESLSVYPNRLPTNRGNGYIRPLDRILASGRAASIGGFPSFDCDNTGGQRVPGDGKSPATGIGPPQFAPCFVDPDFAEEFGGGRAPQVSADGAP
jgi:phospholipid/cholesterol/gamma-HCH transport system substrate-binding protein